MSRHRFSFILLSLSLWVLLSACGAPPDASPGSATNSPSKSDEVFDNNSPEQLADLVRDGAFSVEDSEIFSDAGQGLETPTEALMPKDVIIRVYRFNPQKKPGPVALEHVDVFVKGEHVYTWLVSTACNCKKVPTQGPAFVAVTPTGSYRIWTTGRYQRSTEFGNAKMYFALFFNGGRALHATYGDHVAKLGHPDSAGCVRQSEPHAELLWNLVMSRGLANARVIVSDLQDRLEKMYPLTP